jgi:hypothetical protein
VRFAFTFVAAREFVSPFRRFVKALSFRFSMVSVFKRLWTRLLQNQETLLAMQHLSFITFYTRGKEHFEHVAAP